MQTDVLLSIKPEFADAIFSGKKLFEFRKKAFSNREIGKVYVYASRPICSVIGEFELDEILSDAPAALWETTKHASGISKEYFESYFESRVLAFAFKVGNKRLYDTPQPLFKMFNIIRPPQSFMYINKNNSK